MLHNFGFLWNLVGFCCGSTCFASNSLPWTLYLEVWYVDAKPDLVQISLYLGSNSSLLTVVTKAECFDMFVLLFPQSTYKHTYTQTFCV